MLTSATQLEQVAKEKQDLEKLNDDLRQELELLRRSTLSTKSKWSMSAEAGERRPGEPEDG